MVKRKKSDRKKLKDKLEKVVKALVKARDNRICQKSGEQVEGANCHASHVIPVSRDGRLAFDPENLKVLSFHNHINWWHKHPTESGKWFREKFPQRMESLEKKHLENQTKGPIKMAWLEEQLEIRTKQLREESYENPKPLIKLQDLDFL